MRIRIYLTRGRVGIGHMPDESALRMVEEFQEGDSPTLTFTLDDESITHIARPHIVRIDLDPEVADHATTEGAAK